VFGIFNGVPAAKAQVVDGLILGSALDPARTPTASIMMFERIGDLTDDPAADEARFEALAAGNPVAAEGSLSAKVIAHLTPDVGPKEQAQGGDLLLQMPIGRSWARGPDFRDDG
jgi:hypothetical protein